MTENETMAAEETTAPVAEYTEAAEVLETEATETTETIVVDVDRPFMTLSFEEYTVSEGLLLLIFVLVLLNFFLNLTRR